MSRKLNKRQQIAAEMLGIGHRPSAVAAKLFLSRETISRWQQDTNFQQVLQECHLKLLSNLLADRLLLIDKCHRIVSEAFENGDISATAKSGLAIRYLALTGTQSNIYGGIEKRQDFLLAKDEKSSASFKKIVNILRQLAALKSSNNNFSDAEYRKRAEDIVHSLGPAE